MKNGILKSMGIDELPQVASYDFGFGFEISFEPNKEAIERLRKEHAERRAAGDTGGYEVHLTDEEIDCVVYGRYFAKRQGGVMLAGGLVPQAMIRGREIDRIPKVELFKRTEAAFAGMKG